MCSSQFRSHCVSGTQEDGLSRWVVVLGVVCLNCPARRFHPLGKLLQAARQERATKTPQECVFRSECLRSRIQKARCAKRRWSTRRFPRQRQQRPKGPSSRGRPCRSGCGSAFTPNNTTKTFQSKALRALNASNRSQLLPAMALSTQVGPSLFPGSVFPFKPPGHSAFLGRYPEFPRVLFATSRRRRPSFYRTM